MSTLNECDFRTDPHCAIAAQAEAPRVQFRDILVAVHAAAAVLEVANRVVTALGARKATPD